MTPGKPRLFHVSDLAGIAKFEPRPPPLERGPRQPCVWAVDEAHLPFYLLPRDCPRVCFFAQADSDPADVERLLGVTEARSVVAIESAWLDRVRSATVWVYGLPSDTFALFDSSAGHWVSSEAVAPLSVEEVADCLGRTAACGVELRLVPSLWPLRDAVVASTLSFSCIRMRKATPRRAAAGWPGHVL